MTMSNLFLPAAFMQSMCRAPDGAGDGAADAGAAGGDTSAAGQGTIDAAGDAGKTDDGAAEDASSTSILGGTKPDAGETSESGATEAKTEGDDKADGDDKDGDAADVVPEDGVYTLELPEGMEIDEALSTAAFPVFKEMGLTTSQANKLAGVYAEHAAKQAEAQQTMWEDLNEGWAKTARADKELQGEGFDTTVAIADRALSQLGTPQLVEDMVKYGWGNHPEFIRFAYRAGKLIADDATQGGDTTGADATPAEERLYGKTTPTSKKG